METTSMNFEESTTQIKVPGTSMRSQVYKYGNKRMYKTPEMIEKIGEKFPSIPLIYDHTEHKDLKLGEFRVTDSKNGMLVGDYIFNKKDTPSMLLDAIRDNRPIPTSDTFRAKTVKSTNKDYDMEQDISWMYHIAVVHPDDEERWSPRCTIGEGCGAGVVQDSSWKDS